MWITDTTDFVPPPWSCGKGNATGNFDHRVLSEESHDDSHDHFDHYHSDHRSGHDPSGTAKLLADIQRSLRGSELRIGKRRRMQSTIYTYWVDIYIEIDYKLCRANGESCVAGIGPNTLSYGERDHLCTLTTVDPILTFRCIPISPHSVNALFVGANTIYEVRLQYSSWIHL